MIKLTTAQLVLSENPYLVHVRKSTSLPGSDYCRLLVREWIAHSVKHLNPPKNASQSVSFQFFLGRTQYF